MQDVNNFNKQRDLHKQITSKVYTLLNLNNVCSWMFKNCFYVFLTAVHESLVCPVQLNCPMFFKNAPGNAYHWFSSIFCTFETFSMSDCMILRSLRTFTDAQERNTMH